MCVFHIIIHNNRNLNCFDLVGRGTTFKTKECSTRNLSSIRYDESVAVTLKQITMVSIAHIQVYISYIHYYIIYTII